MDFSRTKQMTQPPQTDWAGIITIVSLVGGLVAVFFKWIDSYFASKAKEQSDFIQKVVQASVDTILDKSFKDVREDIQTLFRYREQDRAHIDGKFDKIMMEMKK